tara:strand:+ start:347 stop:865 length:519 start_codon:yes stop_codon:yes gene_type:complete
MATHADFLEQFILENKIEIFAEIGVFKGRLLHHLQDTCSSVIKEYWAIDPWAPLGKEHGRYAKYLEKEWNRFYRAICARMSHWPSLHVVRLQSREASRMFDKPHFDFIYIDALHTYEDCLADIKAWLPRVKEGGFLGGHDYTPERGVFDAVNEKFEQAQIKTGDNMVWYVKV